MRRPVGHLLLQEVRRIVDRLRVLEDPSLEIDHVRAGRSRLDRGADDLTRIRRRVVEPDISAVRDDDVSDRILEFHLESSPAF